MIVFLFYRISRQAMCMQAVPENWVGWPILILTSDTSRPSLSVAKDTGAVYPVTLVAGRLA